MGKGERKTRRSLEEAHSQAEPGNERIKTYGSVPESGWHVPEPQAMGVVFGADIGPRPSQSLRACHLRSLLKCRSGPLDSDRSPIGDGEAEDEAEPRRGTFPGRARTFAHKSIRAGGEEEESLTETRRHGERKEEMKVLV